VLAVILQKLSAFKEKAEQKKQELTQAEAASQEGDDGDNERRQRLEDLAKEAEESSALKQALEQDLKRSTEPHKALERQLKLLKKEEEKADRSLVLAMQRLQSKRAENAAKAGSAESEQARRNERLQIAEEKLATTRARHSELKQAVTNALEDYERVEPNVLDARDNVSQIENKLHGIKSKIQSLESSSGNSFDVFGQRCAKVKRLIDAATQQRKFRGPVLGPIGFYCKLAPGKDEFAAIAETALGVGVLDRFVVCNDLDRKLLQKIRSEAGCQQDCSIFQISQFPRYNIPAPPEMDGVETIATVLAIDNDIIFNCLVDNCKIDERALTRGKDDSERLLLVQNENGQNCIRGGKIKEVYFLPKGDNWKLTKNGHKQMVSNSRRLTKSIGADMTAAVEEAKREYQAMKHDLEIANRVYNKLEHEHTEHKKRWNFNKRDLVSNQKSIDDAQKEIEDIKTEENMASDIDFDTTVEEQEVSEAQEFLDDSKARQEKLKEEIEEKRPAIQDLKYKLEEVTTRNEKVLADLKEAENDLTQHFHQLSQIKEKIEKKRQKLIQYETVISERTKQVIEAKDAANEALSDAKRVQYNQQMLEMRFKQREANGVQPSETQLTEYSQDPTEADLAKIEIPDLTAIHDPEHYDIRIQRATEHIQREKERRLSSKDDEASAYERYIRAKETYQHKQNQIAEIDEQCEHLNDDMVMRRRRWEAFREFISDYAGLKFDETRELTSFFFCSFAARHSILTSRTHCFSCHWYYIQLTSRGPAELLNSITGIVHST
jgi:chromosome segregation ATPase